MQRIPHSTLTQNTVDLKKRVRSYPAEEYIEPERLTRKGLKIVVLRKTTRELRSGEKIPAVEKNWKPLE